MLKLKVTVHYGPFWGENITMGINSMELLLLIKPSDTLQEDLFQPQEDKI